MALSVFEQGSALFKEGDSHILLVTKGSVEANFRGHLSRYEKGDIIGLCGLSANNYKQTYTALTEVAALPYPRNFEELAPALRDNADVANLFVKSMVSQLADISRYRNSLKHGADEAYKALTEIYPEYERLCALLAFTSKRLPGITDIAPFADPAPTEGWLYDYYKGIKELSPAVTKGFFYGNTGVSMGFLQKGVEDMSRLYKVCEGYVNYLNGFVSNFINADQIDLFALLADLHNISFDYKGADAPAEALMIRLTALLSSLKEHHDQSAFQSRLTAYKEAVFAKRTDAGISADTAAAAVASADAPAGAPVAAAPKRNLNDSLEQILAYSECSEDLCNKFTRGVRDYMILPDRADTDDSARKIRKDLATMFYDIYKAVMIKSMKDPAVSTIIKMFLNFGYVDAALAGLENADYLYSIADSLKGDPVRGIYTIREWMIAVYKGEKEPNRNEFDLDYGEYLHDLKVQGRIGEVEEKKLLQDVEGKLRFELENAFPITNKITFGRITTFCPLFSSHCVLRKLEMSLVTPALINKLIDEVREIDYSAFTREILYTNEKCGVQNETLHVEVLPNIILTPNVGIRASMWQEIEGRKRGTPARMFMPIFLEGDLKKLIIRIVGEFRWEMCKRIQGMRWNDITNPSLTSEFSDYLQFYRNNKEITVEMREDIKAELAAAKKNYKNVFVSNYTEWLLFESQGSPRLNKFVLRFMIKYCPFPIEKREKLMQNPRYAQHIARQEAKVNKRSQILERLIQKVERVTGKPAPQELTDELEFSRM
jgi:hypothetical protein